MLLDGLPVLARWPPEPPIDLYGGIVFAGNRHRAICLSAGGLEECHAETPDFHFSALPTAIGLAVP